MYQVAFKSGTAGYYEEDNCDFILAEFPSTSIPNVGDILEFGNKGNKVIRQYLVKEVKRTFTRATEFNKFNECIKVYVIQCYS